MSASSQTPTPSVSGQLSQERIGEIARAIMRYRYRRGLTPTSTEGIQSWAKSLQKEFEPHKVTEVEIQMLYDYEIAPITMPPWRQPNLWRLNQEGLARLSEIALLILVKEVNIDLSTLNGQIDNIAEYSFKKGWHISRDEFRDFVIQELFPRVLKKTFGATSVELTVKGLPVSSSAEL
ncbi:MAG: hypothetical protein WCV82_00920 [Candidatus Paceibacterota bacterium]